MGEEGAKPTVLVTRPTEAAEPLRQALSAKGYGVLIEPLLVIQPIGRVETVSEGVQAIALTSANAVPALGAAARRLPIYTVGTATARAAEAAGCDRILSSDDDARALAGLIAKNCRPECGAILHLSGEVVRDELRRDLAAAGFALRRQIVYRAEASRRLSEATESAWRRRAIGAVLLYSPRTAGILVRLLIDYDLAPQVDSAMAICLSENTAAPCRDLAWKEIRVATHPNQAALIRALEGSIGIC